MQRLGSLLFVFLVSCAQTAEGPGPRPVIGPDPTPVDLLVLKGEARGVVPGTDMQRVKALFPELRGISTGVAEAGLLTGPGGLAITTERSGGRVQALWLEFAGSELVPATPLTSADGRLRVGAADADVRAYLLSHGLPLVVREIRAEDLPEGTTVSFTVVREYFVDAALSWLVTVDGVLTKAIVGNRHVYGSGRKDAELVPGK